MKDSVEVPAMMSEIGRKGQGGGRRAGPSPPPRSAVAALELAAGALEASAPAILDANARDMEAAREKGLSAAMARPASARRPPHLCHRGGPPRRGFPEGPRGRDHRGLAPALGPAHPPGGARRFGVIGVIYESRPKRHRRRRRPLPQVRQCRDLCAAGRKASTPRRRSMPCLVEGLKAAGLPEAAIQLVPTTDRAAVSEMLTMTGIIDVIVPRGGKGLVGLVQREARVPVFAHLEGIVHVYIDAAADPEKALKVVLNAKDPPPGVSAGPPNAFSSTATWPAPSGRALIRALIDAGVESARGRPRFRRSRAPCRLVRTTGDVNIST